MFTGFSDLLNQPAQTDVELGWLWNEPESEDKMSVIENSDSSNRFDDVSLFGGVDRNKAGEILPPHTIILHTPDGNPLAYH